jgi:MFS transporter, UMF1 family
MNSATVANSERPAKERFARLMFKKDVFGWALYDFANTIFSMNIVSSYFKPWLVDDLGKSGFTFDLTVALSMLCVAVLSPALGAISDNASRKKRFLFVFTVSCFLSVAGLSVLPVSMFVVILFLFGLSNFFYEGSMVFYNALLYSVAENDTQARFISGYGVALGYLGAIIGLFVVLPFVDGNLFGIEIPFIDGSGKSGAFLPTAFMFLVLAAPLFLFVHERPSASSSPRIGLSQAYKSLWRSILDAEKYPGLLRFLLTDFFIKNAVNAVIINIGVFCLYVIGLTDAEKTIFLSIVTLAAVIGSFVIGRIAVRIPLRSAIIVIALGWIVTMALFGIAVERWQYWGLSALAGVLLGGVWTVHRPYFAEMVPRDELGKFFGLYSLTGKSAAVLGPLWWGLFFWLFQSDGIFGKAFAESFPVSAELSIQLPYRAAAASLSLLVFAGLLIFIRGKRAPLDNSIAVNRVS